MTLQAQAATSKKPRTRWLGVLGVAGSVLWIVGAIALIGPSFPTASTMTPNEWGDFFAGMAAPLAFWWLVIGYLQQGQELKQNTEALHLQAVELAQSANHQQTMNDLTRESAVTQSRMLKLSKQPVFSLQVSINLTTHEQMRFEMRVTNVGHPIPFASIIIETVPREPDGPLAHHHTVNGWGNGYTETFAAFVEAVPGNQVKMRIDYFDGLGEEEHQQARAWTDVNSQLHSYVLPWKLPDPQSPPAVDATNKPA